MSETNQSNISTKANKKLENGLESLWQFVCYMWKLAKEDDAMAKTPGITYRFIMGFIPFLIFLVNAILWATAANMDFILEMVYVYFPERMALTLAEDIKRIVAQQNTLWMWVSLIISSYEFTFGLATLVRSTDPKNYDATDEPIPILKTEKKTFTFPFTKNDFIIFFKAFIFNIGLTITIILSLGVIVIGSTLAEILGKYFEQPFLLNGWYNLTYLIPFIFLIIFLMFFYCLSPTKNNPPVKRAFVAALFVTFSWIISTILYRFLLMLIPGMGESYGPLFGLFIMFIWLSFISRFIMGGIYIIKAWEEISSKSNET